ncbi:fibrillarin-like rRNA/tRNA 2'-O-methyltransferase [Candidatus Micrarchaeota archaeon]|nr:fibrillarin-like rRNA/tRNA 2'-O-methyltransferase [Candidatus Micrarchaeota archaeon]
MNIKELFPGVYKINGRFATRSLAPGEKVYGEELVKAKGAEYRIWDPKRSKLCAALVKGLKNLSIKPGSTVLYLGAANGTTASHVSDIVGENGRVYCVEFSPQAMRDLLLIAEERKNMYPVLADARLPDQYKEVGQVDIVYEDVADRSQTDILLRNFELFKARNFLIAIKARCIDSTAAPRKVYNEEKAKLAKNVKVNELIILDPFEKDHCMITGEGK